MVLKTILIVVGVIAAVVLVLSIVPYPGLCDASVSVSSYQVGVIVGTVFGISGVSGTTTGQTRIIDWNSILGFTGPQLTGTFKMTVCLQPGNHCTSKSASEWFPTVPFVGGQVTATNQFSLGYIPDNQAYGITASLTDNGNDVADGSGSITVGC